MNSRPLATPMYAVVLAAAFAITSCAPYAPHARVARANYNVSRGEYQAAIVDYLRALETDEYDDWLAYNLANVYHFLGESEAAVDRWERAQTGDVEDLLFGASFNTGVYLYEQGRYNEAFDRFRFALTIDPSSVDAKRNLELAIEKIAAETELSNETGDAATVQDPEAEEQQQGSSAGTRMLDYVRRKQEQRWRATRESVPSTEARDW
jgi:tetratricopeptide (TPR) repeat protein